MDTPQKIDRTKNSRFQRGSAVFTCGECGKKTRDTGKGEASVEMCAKCYDAALQANAVADGDEPDPDALAAQGELDADAMSADAEEDTGQMIALGYAQ